MYPIFLRQSEANKRKNMFLWDEQIKINKMSTASVLTAEETTEPTFQIQVAAIQKVVDREQDQKPVPETTFGVAFGLRNVELDLIIAPDTSPTSVRDGQLIIVVRATGGRTTTMRTTTWCHQSGRRWLDSLIRPWWPWWRRGSSASGPPPSFRRCWTRPHEPSAATSKSFSWRRPRPVFTAGTFGNRRQPPHRFTLPIWTWTFRSVIKTRSNSLAKDQPLKAKDLGSWHCQYLPTSQHKHLSPKTSSSSEEKRFISNEIFFFGFEIRPWF